MYPGPRDPRHHFFTWDWKAGLLSHCSEDEFVVIVLLAIPLICG